MPNRPLAAGALHRGEPPGPARCPREPPHAAGRGVPEDVGAGERRVDCRPAKRAGHDTRDSRARERLAATLSQVLDGTPGARRSPGAPRSSRRPAPTPPREPTAARPLDGSFGRVSAGCRRASRCRPDTGRPSRRAAAPGSTGTARLPGPVARTGWSRRTTRAPARLVARSANKAASQAANGQRSAEPHLRITAGGRQTLSRTTAGRRQLLQAMLRPGRPCSIIDYTRYDAQCTGSSPLPIWKGR